MADQRRRPARRSASPRRCSRPATNRLAFGVIDKSNNFVYGKSAVYIAKRPGATRRSARSRRRPTRSLTKPAFRSQNAAVDSSPIAQIYAARRAASRRPATWNVLVVTKQGTGMVGAPAQVKVTARRARRRSPTSGSVPPRVSTDTVASAAGNLAVDRHAATVRARTARDELQGRARQEAGRAAVRDAAAVPVARLRAGRRHRAADEAAVRRPDGLHPRGGLPRQPGEQGASRAQLEAFHLQTEPWLFTIDKDGRIAARLEGSFGVNEFRRAIQAALN